MATKIFIVEDTPSIVGMYQKAFQLADFQVETADDGEEALEKLKKMKTAPDLILLDYIMPKYNGFEMLKKIKQDSDFSHLGAVPVVMMTNLTSLEDPDDVNKAISLGAVTYFIKSDYDPSEIVKKVSEIISNYKTKT